MKPHRLRHKEMLNDLNQVKGFEQKFKSLNGVNHVNLKRNARFQAILNILMESLGEKFREEIGPKVCKE
jgi:phosphotransferase system IIB component